MVSRGLASALLAQHTPHEKGEPIHSFARSTMRNGGSSSTDEPGGVGSVRIAAHAYEHHEKEDDQDLLFDEGDKIRIIDAGDGSEGWWRGQNLHTMEVGNFPSNYLRPPEPPAPGTAAWLQCLQHLSDDNDAREDLEERLRAAKSPRPEDKHLTFQDHELEVSRSHSLHRANSVNRVAMTEQKTCVKLSKQETCRHMSRQIGITWGWVSKAWYYVVTSTVDHYRSTALFILLGFFVLALTAIFSVLWFNVIYDADNGADEDDAEDHDHDHDHDHDREDTNFGIGQSFVFTILVFFTGEYDSTFVKSGRRNVVATYVVTVLAGILLFSTAIGVVTDAVMEFVKAMNDGRSAVLEHGHTVVLGYNENTPRVVLQIAYFQQDAERELRKTYAGWFTYLVCKLMGRRWAFRFMLHGSYSLLGKVVILANGGDKLAIIRDIDRLLDSNGVDFLHGRRLFCVRIGDTSDPADLKRVSTHRAANVLVSCTAGDDLEYEASAGKISNGTTMRTLLAIRSLLFSAHDAARKFPKQLNVVLQTNSESVFVDAAAFCGPTQSGDDPSSANRDNRVVQQVNTHMMNNKLLFRCATSPGLSKLFLHDLLSFDGTAIRCLPASELPLPPKMLEDLRKKPNGGILWKTLLGETHWEDAVLIGIGDSHKAGGKPDPDRAEEVDGAAASSIPYLHDTDVGGICPSPDARIYPETLVIFVSLNLKPTLADDSTSYKLASSKDLTQSPMKLKMPVVPVQNEKRVLVCGWRGVWRYRSGKHEFGKRLDEMAGDLAPGSVIVFFNTLLPSDFADRCSELTKSGKLSPIETKIAVKRNDSEIKSWEYSPINGKRIIITHLHGDPANYDDIRELFLPLHVDMPFSTAIVLSEHTTAKQHHASSRDTCTLATLLLLRHFTSDLDPKLRKIHCIAETFLDRTATLAAVPLYKSGTTRLDSPDFILVQKMTARALTMALAFPKLQPHIAELFHPGDSHLVHSPEIHLMSFDGSSARPLRFGEIQEFVVTQFANWGIAIGIVEIETGNVTIAPPPTQPVSPKDYRIAVMVRRKKPGLDAKGLQEASRRLERGTVMPAIVMQGDDWSDAL